MVLKRIIRHKAIGEEIELISTAKVNSDVRIWVDILSKTNLQKYTTVIVHRNTQHYLINYQPYVFCVRRCTLFVHNVIRPFQSVKFCFVVTVFITIERGCCKFFFVLISNSVSSVGYYVVFLIFYCTKIRKILLSHSHIEVLSIYLEREGCI